MVHLVKLCVGVDSVSQLAAFVDYRQHNAAADMSPYVHVTRMYPKRADELADGGSLYWVIKGAIQVRQKILGVEEVIGGDGIRRCAILLDGTLVLTQNQPRRAFQGWRYLQDDDAPADIGPYGGAQDDMPEDMRAELVKLGLL